MYVFNKIQLTLHTYPRVLGPRGLRMRYGMSFMRSSHCLSFRFVNAVMIMTVALWKTVLSPLLTHWRYYSLALSRRCNVSCWTVVLWDPTAHSMVVPHRRTKMWCHATEQRCQAVLQLHLSNQQPTKVRIIFEVLRYVILILISNSSYFVYVISTTLIIHNSITISV